MRYLILIKSNNDAAGATLRETRSGHAGASWAVTVESFPRPPGGHLREFHHPRAPEGGIPGRTTVTLIGGAVDSGPQHLRPPACTRHPLLPGSSSRILSGSGRRSDREEAVHERRHRLSGAAAWVG